MFNMEKRSPNMFKRILVPLDGSPLAEKSLPYAEDIAVHLGSEIILVNIASPLERMDKPDYQGYISRTAAEIEQRIKKSAHLPTGEIVKVVSTVINTDGIMIHPAEHIISYADKNNVSLIIMATHGRTGIGRWALGSTASKVVSAGNCPVLLVRAGGNIPQIHLSKILVPLDGSPAGEAALPYIEALAKKFNSTVSLLGVVETLYNVMPSAMQMNYYGGAGLVKVPYTAEEMKPFVENTEKYLKAVQAKLQAAGIKAEYTTDVGSPGDTIIEAEKSTGATIVAMSARGHSASSLFDYGHVADKVLHGGSLPLLLIKPDKK
jgi:nucleotide-binding universal stress UspA family protein